MDTNCIDWPGTKRGGYGLKHITERDGPTNTSTNAHLWVWERVVGPIPEFLQADHLCRNRGCVYPHHIEFVPPAVNKARAWLFQERPAFCPHGHEFTPENTWIRRDRGHRVCRKCTGLPPAIGDGHLVIGGETKESLTDPKRERLFTTHEGDVLNWTPALARQYEVATRDFLDRNFATRRKHQAALG